LALHPALEVADAPPGAEPAMKRPEGRFHVGRHAREGSEAEGREHQGGPSSVIRSRLICGRTPLSHSIT
jgi:hypothetical protein